MSCSVKIIMSEKDEKIVFKKFGSLNEQNKGKTYFSLNA